MPKETDVSAAGQAPVAKPAPKAAIKDNSDFVSRKLIRPTLSRLEPESVGGGAATAPAMNPTETRSNETRSGAAQDENRRPRTKKMPIVEQTHAETFYFQKQMQTKTLMTFVLKTGEEIQGCIDWFDKACIRVTRTGKPNLLLYKNGIRYMYKSGENTAGRG